MVELEPFKKSNFISKFFGKLDASYTFAPIIQVISEYDDKYFAKSVDVEKLNASLAHRLERFDFRSNDFSRIFPSKFLKFNYGADEFGKFLDVGVERDSIISSFRTYFQPIFVPKPFSREEKLKILRNGFVGEVRDRGPQIAKFEAKKLVLSGYDSQVDAEASASFAIKYRLKIAEIFDRVFKDPLLNTGEKLEVISPVSFALGGGVTANFTEARSRKVNEKTTLVGFAKADVFRTFDTFGLYSERFVSDFNDFDANGFSSHLISGKLLAYLSGNDLVFEERHLHNFLNRVYQIRFNSRQEFEAVPEKFESFPILKNIRSECFFDNESLAIDLMVIPDALTYHNAFNGVQFAKQDYLEEFERLESFVKTL